MLLGKRYIVKVNNVWSVCRGHKEKYGLLRIWYGPDRHEWILYESQYKEIEDCWDEDGIERAVIRQNIHDLKEKHPSKLDNKTNALVNYGLSFLQPQPDENR